jgi:glycosyltransferase involved in cell wall biosynthesis
VPKKILIVTECFYPEEFKINDVALSWKNKGYDVDVLTLVPTYPLGSIYPGYKNKIYSKDEWQGVNVYRVHATVGYKDSALKKILKYFNFMILGSIVSLFIGKKYDYVFGFNMSSLTGMLPAVLIRKLYKKPVTFWALDIWPDSVYAYGFKKTKFLSYFLDKFVKFMYRNVDNIALSSKGFESKLKPYARSNLTFNYFPQWADDLNMSLDPADLSANDKIQFTFAGNVGKLQNLENIINAFCLLSNEYQKKSQLNIIGDGSNLNNLKLLADNNPNIVFHGQKLRSDMASYYKASDFLIISLIDKPIFSVTVPAKTQTYIAAKKPILAIINGDTSDIVRDNNFGLCADPSNINNISNIFQRCIDMSQSERNNFTRENDHLLATIFNKEKTIDKLLELVISRG